MNEKQLSADEVKVFRAGMKEGMRLAIVLMSPALVLLDEPAKLRLSETLDRIQDAYDEL